MYENIQFSFWSAGRRSKGVATPAQTHSSKKLPEGNRRVEMDVFLVTYVGEIHRSELEEEWTDERQ